MGKRKLHGLTYYQCDWTGLPMRATNCYLPSFDEKKKLVKRGSYANWECVAAHAQHMYDNAEITLEQLAKVREHINALVGAVVESAPSHDQLAWFARDGEPGTITSAEEFHCTCCKPNGVVAVRIPPTGEVHEVHCDPMAVSEKFEPHLTRPFNLHGPLHTPQSFQSLRKKGQKDRDLCIYYWPFKNGLPFNQTASHLFKMQVYGDALLVQQTKDPSFLPRERFVNFYMTNFTELTSTNKRKKAEDGIDTRDYKALKTEMQQSLNAVEQRVSASASKPGDLAKAAALPPPSGKELAALADPTGEKRALQKMVALESRLVAAH